jgi:hypothetical protein
LVSVNAYLKLSKQSRVFEFSEEIASTTAALAAYPRFKMWEIRSRECESRDGVRGNLECNGRSTVARFS